MENPKTKYYETKKTLKASLEPKRKRFFVIGTTIALATTLAAFEWGVPTERHIAGPGGTESPFVIEDLPPITFVDKPIEQPQKIEQPNSDQIEIVDELDEIEIEIDVPEIEDVPEIVLEKGTEVVIKEKEVENTGPFIVAEVMPQFIGGEEARLRYLNKHVKYPRKAVEAKIKGTVYVQFVVLEDGSIDNIELVQGIGGGCDEEALRVVKNMPKWKPGEQRGKKVPVQFTLPIKFTLKE